MLALTVSRIGELMRLKKLFLLVFFYYGCWWREGEDQARVGGLVPLGSVVDLC